MTDPSRHGRLHGFLVGTAAASAVVAILSMLAFVTVTWPDRAGRILIGIFLFSILSLFACASAAVFTAARATHVQPHSARGK